MAHTSEASFSELAAGSAHDGGPGTLVPRRLNHLRTLEAESIHILREAAVEFARPVMLYSIGEDSSAMLRLAQKEFFPGKIPFPLLHIDTSYKFPEMIEFRDAYTRQIGAELIVHKNQAALDAGANPFLLGTQKCCGFLKTKSLLDALAEGGFDAAFGGARRDEEKSRAKERIYSFRDPLGGIASERRRSVVLLGPGRGPRSAEGGSSFYLFW
jgi:sulfate adenylyltransferase subunit 2